MLSVLQVRKRRDRGEKTLAQVFLLELEFDPRAPKCMLPNSMQELTKDQGQWQDSSKDLPIKISR